MPDAPSSSVLELYSSRHTPSVERKALNIFAGLWRPRVSPSGSSLMWCTHRKGLLYKPPPTSINTAKGHRVHARLRRYPPRPFTLPYPIPMSPQHDDFRFPMVLTILVVVRRHNVRLRLSSQLLRSLPRFFDLFHHTRDGRASHAWFRRIRLHSFTGPGVFRGRGQKVQGHELWGAGCFFRQAGRQRVASLG